MPQTALPSRSRNFYKESPLKEQNKNSTRESATRSNGQEISSLLMDIEG
jgi:hypothetical protein